MSEPERDEYEFDVALSFAGEDREYVEDVAAALKAADVTYFLDTDHAADMWGENLVEYFEGIFRKRARFAMMFISRHYVEKPWTRLERQNALARQMGERAAYVLPVRLDDASVPGLLPTVHYIDARRTGIDGLVQALSSKLSGSAYGAWPGDRVPRTPNEIRGLLSKRPGSWEYLYFAAKLLEGKQTFEAKYRDHEMRYAAPSDMAIDEDAAVAYLRRATAEMGLLARTTTRMLDPAALERAMGAPGEPGDADRIQHLAMRLTSSYEGFLDLGARLRGATRPDEYDELFDTLARLVDRPIQNYRGWVDDVVMQIDRLPRALEGNEPVHIELTLVIDFDNATVAEFSRQLSRMAAALQLTGELDQLTVDGALFPDEGHEPSE